MLKTIVLALFVGVILTLSIVYGPQISIWALNTLFGLHIPINFKTWFAMLWLSGIVAQLGQLFNRKSK